MKSIYLINISCFGDFDILYNRPVYATDSRQSAQNLVADLNFYFSQHELITSDYILFSDNLCGRDAQKIIEIFSKYFHEFTASIFLNKLQNLCRMNNVIISPTLFNVDSVFYIESKE